MKFSTHLTPPFDVQEFSKTHGAELAYATAAVFYFELIERERRLLDAIEDLELCDTDLIGNISEYTLDAAVHGIGLLIEKTRQHSETLSEQYRCALASWGIKSPVWSEKTEASMSGNFGDRWTRCKEWLASGADPETILAKPKEESSEPLVRSDWVQELCDALNKKLPRSYRLGGRSDAAVLEKIAIEGVVWDFIYPRFSPTQEIVEAILYKVGDLGSVDRDFLCDIIKEIEEVKKQQCD